MSCRNLFALIAVLVLPAAALAQSVVSAEGDKIELSWGSQRGVRNGMTGKICAPEIVGGQAVTNCFARFVVTSVSKEKSIARITKGDHNVAVRSDATFDEPPPGPDVVLLNEANRAYQKSDWRRALDLYERFLQEYPDNNKAGFARRRAEECRTKITPPPVIPPPPPRDEVAIFLDAADLLFREGNYRAALDQYENFPRKYPNHAKAGFAADRAEQCRTKLKLRQADELAATAERLFRDGKFGEARASCWEALRIDSTNARARATLRAVQLKLVQSRFNAPTDVAVGDAGCYVADAGNNTLRLIQPNGSITLAGAAGQHGSADGAPARALFNEPNGVAVASDGTLYVADRYNETIRKIAPGGSVTTLAGRSGLSGTADGPLSAARFHEPRRIAVATDGTVYVADTGNHAVRRIHPNGAVDTVRPSSESDRMDPMGLAIDPEGNVFVADAWSHVIRKIDAGGHLSIFAGVHGVSGSTDGPVGSARFSAPEGVAVGAGGAVFVADTANHTIRKIENGVVTTVAGTAGSADAVDGNGPVARLNRPSGIRSDAQGSLWIADSGNHAIRLMTAGFIKTVAGLPGSIGSSDGTN